MAAKCEMCESLSATHVEAVTQQLHADVRVVARPIALWRETFPVRSRIVIGEDDRLKKAYDRARKGVA